MDGDAVGPFLPDLHTTTMTAGEDEHKHRCDESTRSDKIKEGRKSVASPQTNE